MNGKYVITVAPGEDADVVRRLARLGLQATAIGGVRERFNKRKHVVEFSEFPVLSGYVFLGCDLTDFPTIQELPGVTGFLSHCDDATKPALVSDEVIEEFRQKAMRGEYDNRLPRKKKTRSRKPAARRAAKKAQSLAELGKLLTA